MDSRYVNLMDACEALGISHKGHDLRRQFKSLGVEFEEGPRQGKGRVMLITREALTKAIHALREQELQKPVRAQITEAIPRANNGRFVSVSELYRSFEAIEAKIDHLISLWESPANRE